MSLTLTSTNGLYSILEVTLVRMMGQQTFNAQDFESDKNNKNDNTAMYNNNRQQLNQATLIFA